VTGAPVMKGTILTLNGLAAGSVLSRNPTLNTVFEHVGAFSFFQKRVKFPLVGSQSSERLRNSTALQAFIAPSHPINDDRRDSDASQRD
jgi:hypothetical protein